MRNDHSDHSDHSDRTTRTGLSDCPDHSVGQQPVRAVRVRLMVRVKYGVALGLSECSRQKPLVSIGPARLLPPARGSSAAYPPARGAGYRDEIPPAKRTVHHHHTPE